LIEIINKPLLLHLVGYLCYWQMGFNSVFKGLIVILCCVDRTSLYNHLQIKPNRRTYFLIHLSLCMGGCPDSHPYRVTNTYVA